MKKTNALINAIRSKDTVTGNGAVSHSTSGTSVLDFFATGAGLRSQSESAVTALFSKAYGEDKTLALKALFYLADVRGGQGERRLFRLCYNWLANNDAKVAKKLLKYIPEYTRWDNILESLENTPLEKDAIALLAKQLKVDARNSEPSLAGKWAPSEQASSEQTRRLAFKVRSAMKFSPRSYRKLLSGLRQKLNVVERLMAGNDWENIEFSHVPSKAALLYKNAFNKHTPELYSKFLTKVEKGQTKINAGTLYPYDIVRDVMASHDESALRTLDAQWKALPNYLESNPHNALFVIDTSGSMDDPNFYNGPDVIAGNKIAPITVAVSLAIYFAERTKGAFKNHFIQFSHHAKLLTLSGGNIKEKVNSVLAQREAANTNLQSVFDLILSKALQNNVPADEMPNRIYIVSDMQFDEACSGNAHTNFEVIRNKYKRAGYELPQIVYWRTNGKSDSPVKFNDKGVCLISGCSPSILASALTGDTPYKVMLDVLNSQRYEPIKA